MTIALTGETQGRPGSDETRVPINIDAGTREKLRDLLYRPFMRGVGYSEFIERAVARAYEEYAYDEERQQKFDSLLDDSLDDMRSRLGRLRRGEA